MFGLDIILANLKVANTSQTPSIQLLLHLIAMFALCLHLLYLHKDDQSKLRYKYKHFRFWERKRQWMRQKVHTLYSSEPFNAVMVMNLIHLNSISTLYLWQKISTINRCTFSLLWRSLEIDSISKQTSIAFCWPPSLLLAYLLGEFWIAFTLVYFDLKVSFWRCIFNSSMKLASFWKQRHPPLWHQLGDTSPKQILLMESAYQFKIKKSYLGLLKKNVCHHFIRDTFWI